jgi:FkbM family methyltransferase
MMHDPIFEKFSKVTSTSTGAHMFDFIGGHTKVAYKSGWAKHAVPEGKEMKPGLPPLNEHYFDWVATLTAVDNAKGVFRMAELGAGWGPWLVRGALAARQRTDITKVELLGVEADPQHFEWMQDHFRDNGVNPDDHHMIFGAASADGGTLRFPVVANPDVDYGASLTAAKADIPYIEVPSFKLKDILSHFSGPLDFMHVDIQGAEYDLLPDGMDDLKRNVKSIMIGTHQANEKHDNLAKLFRDNGWEEVLNFERNGLNATPYGEIQFGDGFLLFSNPDI